MANNCTLTATRPVRPRIRPRSETLPGFDRLLLFLLGATLILTAAILFYTRRSEMTARTVQNAIRDDLARACQERAELTRTLLRAEGQ